MNDFINGGNLKQVKAIHRGWSNDQKYYVETARNEKRLLRVTDIAKYEQKQAEFVMIKQIAALDIPMSQPLDFGVCDGGKKVYSLLSWCEGEDAEAVLPKMSESKQYKLGWQSGKFLRKMHGLSAPKETKPWDERFNRKIDDKISHYQDCGIKLEGDDQLIAYIQDNRDLLTGRPQSFQHGDYHTGNMIISPTGELNIIDFNRYSYGDPWEEFNRIVWSAAASPHFATGQLNGYFNGQPPLLFFKLLALYIANNTLSSIFWSIPFGKQQVAIMIEQANDVLTWFDHMKQPVPTWYLPELMS